ncbi:uncharacterized protein N7459_000597 [Penicillium hispanicum]|uniref:uncharacterized protein n=1 Tax=Penicillium hispanicum TaxID=1080232 RepID=UPI002542516E|nr:uncharacterized protein N7459_000597 [Penicillium hispanicum]KAJ5594389.1 hypothetical protein N7459_000597 [Penicillium hispanicum]
MGATTQLILSTALFALFLAIRRLVSGKKPAPLPPGPKGKPIIGNLFDLPSAGKQEWQHWLEHKELYGVWDRMEHSTLTADAGTGPLSSVTVLGQTIVIINDRSLALHILEKNSAKHSSRPHLVFAELAGWGQVPSSQDNTSLLRTYRRAMTRVLGMHASASRFDHLLEVEARRFLWRVLQTPQDFLHHTRTAAGAFILKIIYGYNIQPHSEDPLVALADLALQQFSHALVPGVWLVDIIPALKYVPEWFPGAGFQKTARYYRETVTKAAEDPFTFTKYQMSYKAHRPSFVSELLEQGEDDHIIKWGALGLYGGGADTTVSALEGFFLAMTLFPEVQRNAHDEIDRVLGSSALPTVADRSRLPYIDALVKETLRWHIVAPGGIPHRTDEDDVVNGFLIPKDAILMPNIWAFNHDPTVHPEPSQFRPERYLSDEGRDTEPDPHDTVFGFGRRICPGRLVADTSLFLTIAHTIAVFDITKSTDQDGKEIDPPVEFTPGLLSHPVPYTCAFTARSEQHRALILDFERNTPFETGDAERLAEALGTH